MSQRLPVDPAPGPLEDFASAFDDLFTRRSQRESFRRYLEGLLLPAERNKTLTGLAGTEPIEGATKPPAQRLQWFLSESTWDPAEIGQRRLELLRKEAATAPTGEGALVIDETGDRKWGAKTAHVGRQYLGSIGKVDNGVVSVHTLFADEQIYYPVQVEPYTPAHHFERGKQDAAFRTKPEIALELVEAAVAGEMPFRAVVADAFYGESDVFRSGLLGLQEVGYVLAVGPSHAWWHKEPAVGSVYEAALEAPWKSDEEPGRWRRLERSFRDGHSEEWWALEAEAGPYGPEHTERLVIATTDPKGLPEKQTWQLVTNLPVEEAPLAEVVRLYGLRVWIEQGYKQVKGALGWAEYQVRSDEAIRRHWQLVCCAFSFCWWVLGRKAEEPLAQAVRGVAAPSTRTTRSARTTRRAAADKAAGGGKKRAIWGFWARGFFAAPPGELAGGAAEGQGVALAVPDAQALLAGLVGAAPAGGTRGTARLAMEGASH